MSTTISEDSTRSDELGTLGLQRQVDFLYAKLLLVQQSVTDLCSRPWQPEAFKIIRAANPTDEEVEVFLAELKRLGRL